MEKDQVMIKGVYLKALVNLVKSKKGNEGLEWLKIKMGEINFSAVNDYPMVIQDRLDKAAAEIIYGKYKEEYEKSFGALAASTWINSIIGKTALALIGNDPMKIALALPKFINSVTSGMDIRVEQLKRNQVKVTMANVPVHVGHYWGACEQAVIAFGYVPRVEAKVLAPGEYEYLVEWNRKLK